MTRPETRSARVAAPLPRRAGVGFKPEHFEAILAERPDVGFFEIHAENYMGDGGPPHRRLEAIRALYPLSLHGVGLSIGSPRPLDRDHLARLAACAAATSRALFSEHLAWSSHDEGFLDDLLPLPYTRRRWPSSARHIDETQEALGARMLLENPSTYVLFAESDDRRDRIPRRDRAPHRLRPAARRQQRRRLARPITASTRSPISTPFRSSMSARSISPATPRRDDDAGAPLLIDAHDSPVRPGGLGALRAT